MIYQRSADVYVVPLGVTPEGHHQETEPVAVAPVASPLAVGEAVLLALQSSGMPIAALADRTVVSPVPARAGARSWASFVRGTAACDLEQQPTEYLVMGLVPAGAAAFEYPSGAPTRIPIATEPADLGDTILAVLADCARH